MSGKRALGEEIKQAADATFRDTEIEYQLMAYLVRVNPAMCSGLKADWFSDIILQDVFEVVYDLRITFSAAMLLNEIKDRGMSTPKDVGVFEEVISQLMGMETAGYNEKNAHHMIVQLLRLYESRRVLAGCAEIIISMKDFDLVEAQDTLSGLSRGAVLLDSENTGYYLDDFETRVGTIEEREKQAEENENLHVGVPTGIYRFDHLTGGMLPGEFGIMLGKTGVGKTAGLIEFACNAWEDGHDVMLVSGEMSKEDLQFRIDSRLTRINGLKFRNAELDDSEKKSWKSTIMEYRAKHNNCLFVAAYPRNFTADDVEKDLLRVQEETGRTVDMIGLDYINIMNPIKTKSKKDSGGWQDQADAVWDFKGLCQAYKLVGWTAGQVKDEAYEKELYDAQDAKYARSLSEAAFVMVGLIQTPKDMIEKRMKFQIIKMRNAPTPPKPIILTPNLGIMRLHEEIRSNRTLAGKLPDTLDVAKQTKKARPRRTLNGR